MEKEQLNLNQKKLRVVCISDTHNDHDNISFIPDGDVLIHVGDITDTGTEFEIDLFSNWVSQFPHKYKIFVPGNHDLEFEKSPKTAEKALKNFIILNQTSVEIEGYTFWGSAFQPIYHDWAFGRTQEELREKWDELENFGKVDVLLTHTPPYGILDTIITKDNKHIHVGCKELLKTVSVVKPLFHVFGHVHESYGIFKKDDLNTLFINASSVDKDYKAIQKPFVFDLGPNLLIPEEEWNPNKK
ncbi:metallophosphoesterase [Anaeramoeba ignava]|uniref:Metallophosphoesterase n=1 Tax=Anaeramoeba ignava TaxID=1746090 RepID=A0A9Q0L6J8_ANAIG|nr:metallophosphoesterase [Anaeramoeba ignava]